MTGDQERVGLEGAARVQHWEQVHSARAPEEASWWQTRPEVALRWIAQVATSREARIVDVGGGASTLVDHLLEAGYENVTVVDISQVALERVRARLGERGDHVTWVAGDVLEVAGPFDLWHDRAVFHFLVDDDDRVRYHEVIADAVTRGGHAVIATFGPAAPEYCSGLPVRRYGAEELATFFGAAFEPVGSTIDLHQTPSGATQEFVAVLMRRL